MVEISNDSGASWVTVPTTMRSNAADRQIVKLTPLPEHLGSTFTVKVTKIRAGFAVEATRSFTVS